MTMYDAPSDRDYAEYLNGPNPADAPDPDDMLPEPEPFPLPEGECPF